MKYIHTVTIEQLPDGRTRLTQESVKEGEGRPSPQFTKAMADYFETFDRFFAGYTDKPVSLLTAEPGRMRLIE